MWVSINNPDALSYLINRLPTIDPSGLLRFVEIAPKIVPEEPFMYRNNRILDCFFLVLIVTILVGLPFGIAYYDRHVSSQKIPSNARVFTLTGHAGRGWLMGEVPAYGAISFWQKQGQPIERPEIEVKKGDLVVFKLASSDVVHGFSLKDFGIYLTDGIQPGKVIYVSFKADQAGTFTFSCNAICGDMHQNMQGTLVVTA